MAIIDALFTVQLDWAKVERRLTTEQLTSIRLALDEQVHGRPQLDTTTEERVFATLAASLDPEHPAWTALRESGTRFEPGLRQGRSIEVILGLRNLVEITLGQRDRALESHADGIEAAARRSILLYGFAPEFSPGAAEDDMIVIDVNNQRVIPAFQLDQDGETRPVVARVNLLLDAFRDPLGAASWWLSPNGWLDTLPAALLDTPREDEIVYAAEQLLNDSW